MSQWPGDEIEVRNRQTLEELAQTLEWSVGEFHLFLARCNYVAVRSQLITQLQDICSIRLQIITLTADTQQLYTTLRDAIAVSLDPPEGIIVAGFEQVKDLDRLFANADAAREEFRKQLPMPIVLWLDDPQFNSFKDRAPNFETWAPVDTPTFEIPTDTIVQSLQQGIEAVYAAAFDPDQPNLVAAARNVAQLGDLRRSELPQAIHTLSERAMALPAELQTDLDWIKGVDAGLENEALGYFQACANSWRNQVQTGQTQNTTPAANLKLALALSWIGWFHFETANQTRRFDQARYDNHNDWQQARQPLEESLHIFEAAERPDMVAKIIRRLLGTLRRLEAWDDLLKWVPRAIALHQQYQRPNHLSMDYGFFAEALLHQQDWSEAKRYAQLAIDTLQQVPASKRWAEGLYLSLQAKAEVQMGNQAAAIRLLERARDLGDRRHPTTYSTILGELRDLYWQQKRYLEAFKLKQARLEVEKIAGIRAFVGAGRLGAQARLVEESDEPAPEIYASGRQLDLRELLGRINSTDSKLTVLHGDSGVGKSSLVNAGLIPALQKEAIGYRSALPVIVRQYMNWEKELATALTESIQASSRSKTVQVPESSPDILAMLRQCEQNNRYIVLVFDQFEEFFFANPDPVQRRQFFQFLSNCLEITYLNIILSLREDYLHYLLEASRALRSVASPNMLSQNLFSNILGRDILYPIGNFNPEQAKAIIDDLTRQSRSYLEPDLVDALVADLAGPLQEVRPIELQIVGSQLETERIRSLAQYRELGDQPKEELVSRYLQEVVDDCGAEYEQITELVLYLLTDERGTRPLKTQLDLRRELEALLPGLFDALTPDPFPSNGLALTPSPSPNDGQWELEESVRDPLDHVLKILCGSGIVVYLPEDLDDRYQLVHDYIAETIRRQKGKSLSAEMAELRQQQEESQAEIERLRNEILQTELEQEKWRRQQAEILQEQTSSKLAAANRRLRAGTGILVASFLVASVAVPMAIRAIQTVSQKDEKVKEANLQIEEAEAEAQDIAQRAKQTEQAAIQRVEQANLEAKRIKDSADQQVADANQQADVANQQVRQAQQDLEQAKADLTSSEQAIQAANIKLAEAKAQATQAQQLLAKAEIQREITLDAVGIELNGLNALQQFVQNSQLEGIVQGLESAKQLNALIENGSLSQQHLAYSPVLSLQQMLYASAQQSLFQEQNRLSVSENMLKVSFSPDGQQIATASRRGIVRLWSRSGELTSGLLLHQGTILSMEFSPNSQQLVTSSSDGTARIWSLIGRIITSLNRDQNSILLSTNFSHNGQLIVTTSSDGIIRIWNHNGKLIRQFSKHQDNYILNANFSPDGQLIVTASSDSTARLWNLDGDIIQKMYHQDGVRDVDFSPDGRQIATASDDGTTRIWNRHDNKPVSESNWNKSNIFSVSFSLDEQQIEHIFTGAYRQDENEGINVWNRHGKLISELRGYKGKPLGLQLSSDAQRIEQIFTESFNQDGERNINVWNRHGELISELREYEGKPLDVNLETDGYKVVTELNGRVRIWKYSNSQTPDSDLRLKRYYGRAEKASFSRDGHLLAIASSDGRITIWAVRDDYNYLLQDLSFIRRGKTVSSLKFSPNKKMLAVAFSDGIVEVWQVYDLDGLIDLGCDWVRDYLTHNPNVTDEDRALCNIPPRNNSPASQTDSSLQSTHSPAPTKLQQFAHTIQRWLGFA